MKNKQNIKNVTLFQLVEAVSKGDHKLLENLELDEFAADAPVDDDATVEDDADFGDDAEVADDAESSTVTVEIDPTAPLADVLRTIADALTADSDDDSDEVVVDDTEEGDETDEDVLDDSSEDETEESEEDEEVVEEDEIELAANNTSMYTAKTKELKREKKTPSVNRSKTADCDIKPAPSKTGEPAKIKELKREKKTPSINRSKTDDNRLKPTERLIDIGQ